MNSTHTENTCVIKVVEILIYYSEFDSHWWPRVFVLHGVSCVFDRFDTINVRVIAPENCVNLFIRISSVQNYSN
jgi:hypothetical protein